MKITINDYLPGDGAYDPVLVVRGVRGRELFVRITPSEVQDEEAMVRVVSEAVRTCVLMDGLRGKEIEVI